MNKYGGVFQIEDIWVTLFPCVLLPFHLQSFILAKANIEYKNLL